MIDLSNIPKDPGCYLFSDEKGTVIYVGKAKNLKKRVSSYFQNKDNDKKTLVMLEHAKSVDFIITDNEIEALILENNLIKKRKPKYNIIFRDSKRYAYIELTKEKFPRLLLARKRKENGIYFGPFISAETRNYVLHNLKKTFQIRTCKRLPKKECLRYHINLCTAPCIGAISEKDYNIRIGKVKFVLQGKTEELVKKLDSEMKRESNKKNYELALELRNQRDAISWLSKKQLMERQKKYNEDIINFLIREGEVYLTLFNVNRGILENKQDFEFDYLKNEDFIEQFIISYYSENPIPRYVILPSKINPVINDYLSAKRKSKSEVKVPSRGEKKKLLDLVKRNIEITFFGDFEKLSDLKSKLTLNETPNVIECFDISHLSGTLMVASMVQFRFARPDKNNYRRFKIRAVFGIDDTAAIGEVVKRRYSRLKKENLSPPDLIIIDGGIGQLNSGLKELQNLGLRIPIISIAKKFEEIYLPGFSKPLKLDRKSKALKLIQEIRDEAHRFAINYNKLLRRKKLIKK